MVNLVSAMSWCGLREPPGRCFKSRLPDRDAFNGNALRSRRFDP
jgi:hypothetical protein